MRWRFVLKWVAVLALALACLPLAALVIFQRRLLFPHPSLAGAPPRPDEVAPLWLPTPAGRVEAWYLAPLAASEERSPLLLFFHGNGELIDHWPREFDAVRRWGFGVLLVEYPGYGRSQGQPSEASVRAAALAAHDWARAQPGTDASRIVAYGRSLGGAAAAIVAVERSTAGLILESTFTSVRSFAHRYGVPEFFVFDPFDTLAALPAYAGPVLVLHGTRDEIVPPSHAGELARAARRAELHLMPCGHNDCERSWALMGAFLGKHRLLPPGR